MSGGRVGWAAASVWAIVADKPMKSGEVQQAATMAQWGVNERRAKAMIADAKKAKIVAKAGQDAGKSANESKNDLPRLRKSALSLVNNTK